MESLPFDLPGSFWRGCLHAHSDESDGALPPLEVVRRYRDAGYDFVAVTDHFRPEYGYPVTDTRGHRSAGFTTLIGAELHAPGTQLSDEWHIVAVGLPFGFSAPEPDETGPQLARRAREAGAFIGIAHPAASLLTVEEAESMDAAHAVEVYNALAAREDRADSWHLCDVLLARGRRLSAYAADDAHFQEFDPPGLAAWVQVRARSLDPAALLAALKAGHYYSSTGPQIHHVGVDRGVLRVHCSPAEKILLSGGAPAGQARTGQDLTEATLPLGALAAAPYVRVTVVDAAGNRAWTNPIWPAAGQDRG